MNWKLLQAAVVVSLWTLPARAGRPLTIDDADPADPGAVEIEAGVGFAKEGGAKSWELPLGLTYGVCPGLEAGLGFGAQFVDVGEEDESGITDTGLGAKWRIIEECPLGARHALVPSVKIPTADEDKDLGSGETDYDLTWIASRGLGEKAGAHMNLGYSWVGGPDRDVLHYGVALDYQATETLQAVGEIFAERETSGGADTVGQFNLGLRYSASEALVLDLAAGSRIGDEGPDFTATAGLTWTLEQ